MAGKNVRSYLEIGSWSGESIRLAATILPKKSRIVSVDKPFKKTKETYLKQAMEDLHRSGYDTHLFLGDSTNAEIVAKVRALGPFDAVFIDGDHRLSYVKSDWLNYGNIGRLVAFHDIARDIPADDYGGPHEVASFWNEFKIDHKHVEFISEATRLCLNGKAAYGIGVIFN